MKNAFLSAYVHLNPYRVEDGFTNKKTALYRLEEPIMYNKR